MTGPIPPEAQAQDALALVLQAAGHGLQGDMALFRGAADTSGNSPTQLLCKGLITQATDQSWRRSWLLWTTGANAGEERFVQQAEGSNGSLRWQQPLNYPTVGGDRFVLFRDYRFGQWLDWLNETARQIHYPLDVYVAYSDDATLRYPVPAPIKRAGWLQEILVGPKDVAYTSPEARSMRWYHVNPENVAGDLYAVLSKPISQHQTLLFRARPPFAYETGTPYTGLHSALWAAGQDATVEAAITPPVRLFVLGTVWRSLQQKASNLTGQPRALWQQNLERCARQYAQACEEWGPKEMSWEIGYRDDWYPASTVSWSNP